MKTFNIIFLCLLLLTFISSSMISNFRRHHGKSHKKKCKINEANNYYGPNRCFQDSECAGDRRCSGYGWCYGDSHC